MSQQQAFVQYPISPLEYLLILENRQLIETISPAEEICQQYR